jgi:hypothetical protein
MSKAKKGDLNPSKRELWIDFSAAILLCLLVFYLGLPDRWLAAIYCTVPTFSATLSIFRGKWASTEFWTIIGCSLMAHLALVWWIFGSLLRRVSDVPLAICIPFVFLEAGALYYGIKFLEPALADKRSNLKTSPKS